MFRRLAIAYCSVLLTMALFPGILAAQTLYGNAGLSESLNADEPFHGHDQVEGESFRDGSSVMPFPETAAPQMFQPTGPYQADAESKFRSGLLGNRYIDGQYIYLPAPSEIISIADALTGFRTSANIPVPWTSQLQSYVSQDIFISARHLGLSGNVRGFGVPAKFESEVDDWAIGTTLFTDVTEDIRPFVQLGYALQQSSVSLRSSGFSFRERVDESIFLCNFGAEFDLLEQLALRTVLECDVKEFRQSIYTAELVFWAGRHVFLRGGVVGDVDGEFVGSVGGAGLAF